MNHYVAQTKQLNGVHAQDFSSNLVHVISLQNSKAFFYYKNGAYVVYNLSSNTKIHEGLTIANIKTICALNASTLAFINPEQRKLQLLDLNTNQLDSHFSMDLPSQMSVPKGEKRDSTRMQTIVHHGSRLLSLPLSNLLILCQEQKSSLSVSSSSNTTVAAPTTTGGSMSSSGAMTGSNVSSISGFDYVITVINREIFPNFHSQFIYTSPAGQRCQIRAINRKDTVVLWPESVIDSQLSFLYWNVLTKEKGCVPYTMKENLMSCVVGATSWGVNKVAFWMNPSVAHRPELRIMNTQDSNEFKGAIDCYGEQEDWLLADVMFLDPEKNFAVIKRIGNIKQCIDIIALNKFKKTWSRQMTSPHMVYSFALDGKYFIEYPNFNYTAEDEKYLSQNPEDCEEEEKEQNIQCQGGTEKYNGGSIYLHQFESQVANPRVQVMYILEKTKMVNRLGLENCKRIIFSLFSNSKQ